MLIIVIFVIIFGIFGYKESWEEPSGAILGGIMGFMIGLLMFLCFGGVIGTGLKTEEIITEEPIYALSDSSSISGGSYLFSGYVNEEYVCRYVIMTDKGKHVEQINMNNVYIHEGDYEPIIKKHTFDFKEEWYWLFAAYMGGDDYVEFYVPENTITTQYNVDLQ